MTHYDPNASRRKKKQLNFSITDKDRELINRAREVLDIPSDKGTIMALIYYAATGKIPEMEGVGRCRQPKQDQP